MPLPSLPSNQPTSVQAGDTGHPSVHNATNQALNMVLAYVAEAIKRENHTGTQPLASIVDLLTELDDRALVGHSHVAGDTQTGTFSVARLTPRVLLVWDQIKEGNALPTARSQITSRTDLPVLFVGADDPGSIVINGDMWDEVI